MRFVISFFVFISIGSLFLSPIFAKENIVKQDLNKDGKIDRIVHFDGAGNILKLEVDSNDDGKIDRFQYYKDKILIRLESDTDHDQQIDSVPFSRAETDPISN